MDFADKHDVYTFGGGTFFGHSVDSFIVDSAAEFLRTENSAAHAGGKIEEVQ